MKWDLLPKDISQKFGSDYDGTFIATSVGTHTTMRVFLTTTVYKYLSVKHVDIETAFLHDDLQQEI